jgi:hypothetical protein
MCGITYAHYVSVLEVKPPKVIRHVSLAPCVDRFDAGRRMTQSRSDQPHVFWDAALQGKFIVWPILTAKTVAFPPMTGLHLLVDT